MLIAFALPQDGEIPVDTPGIIGDPSTGGCDPNAPVSVIVMGDGSCRVGNCAFTAATNFPDCRDSADNNSNPYTFANDWNNGNITRTTGEKWRTSGVHLLIQGNRIGTLKAPRDKFGDMMIAQIPQTLIPTGNSLLKTKVKYSEFRPIMPGRYTN